MKTMKDIKQLVEKDGFIPLSQQTIDVMYGDDHDEDADRFATIHVDSSFVEFHRQSKTFQSLTDIPFVSELIKQGFRTNVMLVESLPESFKTAAQVREMVRERLSVAVGNLPSNEAIDAYIQNRLIADDVPYYKHYQVMDINTSVRWLMTPDEWDALHGIFPVSVPTSQVVDEICTSLKKDGTYHTVKHPIDVYDENVKLLAIINVDEKYIEFKIGCYSKAINIPTIKELIFNGYRSNYQHR